MLSFAGSSMTEFLENLSPSLWGGLATREGESQETRRQRQEGSTTVHT